MQKFKGLGIAICTPFSDDGSVDKDSLHRLVLDTIASGVDYIVCLGTTSETPTLSKQEKEIVVRTIVNANAGKVPLMLGVGGNNTSAVCEELQTTDLSAFEGILSVSPYYNKPSQEGIYRHYVAVAEASSLPVVIYNVTSRTGSNMTPETVLRISESCPNIIGIKEANSDMIQILDLIRILPDNFLVLSGDDMLAGALMLAGGDGAISVIGIGCPREMKQLTQAALSGNIEETRRMHNKLIHIIELIFREGNPTGIKSLLKSKMGINPFVRLPLVQASKNIEEQIATALKTL